MGERIRGKQTQELPDYAQAFTFAGPVTLDFGILKAGDIVVDADVVIETTFDDPTAIVTLGLVSNPGGILASSDTDPANMGTYNNSADLLVAGADALRLQVLPATSTQGSGRAVVTVRRAP